MSGKDEFIKILTPEFRVAFPQVFEPKSIKNGPMYYSLVMLFPKTTDISALKTLAREVRDKKWGLYPPSNLRNPFRDGKEKQFDAYLDCVFASAKTKEKPGLIDMMGRAITVRGDFYSGCWARATLSAYAYDNMGNVGVGFGLLNIQKTRDDKPISNRTAPEQDFPPLNPGQAQQPPANNDGW